MTSKQDFTDQEWTRIRRAPLVAGVAISLADPGGPIKVAKETMRRCGRRRFRRASRSCWRRWPWTCRRWPNSGRTRWGTSSRAAASRCWRAPGCQRASGGQGHAPGGRGVPQVAGGRGAGRCRRGQGRRLSGVRRRAGERRGEEDAGSGARRGPGGLNGSPSALSGAGLSLLGLLGASPGQLASVGWQGLAGGHLPGHISQPPSRGPGRRTQALEGGLGIQLLAAHDDPFGLLDQPPMLQGGLQLIGQPALDLGGARG